MSGKRRWLWIMALAVLPLLGFWLYGLFDLDEGFYGAVVAEMNRRGEWITPYYNGSPWFEKPILLYWLAKPSVMAFGRAFGPRLPSVLATIGLYAICGTFLRRRVSGEAGRWCVGILGTSLIVIAIGRMMITDALLDLCLCAAFLSFYESLVGNRKWRLLTAFCLGLAVLAKGPVSLPLFIALAAWTYISEPDLRPAFKGWWLWGTAALFLTVSAWYLPAYLENGHVFVQKFFVEQNLQRFGGGDEAHKVPLLLWPIYYPVILFVGMLPWSVKLIKGWPKAFRAEAGALQRYLARWALIVLVFFTISGTKLPHYILPAVPPLAMIAAVGLAERKPLSWKLVGALAVGFCLLANGASIYWFHKGGFSEVDEIADRLNRTGDSGLVVAYQLARVKDAPSPLQLNETSNPSLGFYLSGRFKLVEISSLSDLRGALAGASPSVYVITRPGRLSERDLEGLGLSLVPVPGAGQYVLYMPKKREGLSFDKPSLP